MAAALVSRRHGSGRDRKPGWAPPRIIGGTAGGRRIHCPPDPRIRPVTDRVKEALFNILFTVDGSNALDLFAGCGSVGIEALSRGAEHCTFVDDLPGAVAAIRRNVGTCGVEDRSTVVRSDVMGWLERLAAPSGPGPWDLVFVDPPYDLEIASLERIARRLSYPGLMTDHARVVYERRTGDPAPPLPDGCELQTARAYGQTTLYVAERRPRGPNPEASGDGLPTPDPANT